MIAIVDERAESGADDVDRRIRTRIRPLPSMSDSVQSGSRPSSEITSPSISNLDMEAAAVPGNWSLINMMAALYSNRKRRRVYLQKEVNQKLQNQMR